MQVLGGGQDTDLHNQCHYTFGWELECGKMTQLGCSGETSGIKEMNMH